MTKFELLKKYYGYESFRQGQEVMIDAANKGRDVLGIMPTGGGKSICYQIPALMKPGITLVISPLIALMKDQVDGLNDNGIPSTYINSTLSLTESRQRYERIRNKEYKMIYVAPERLLTESFMNLVRSLAIDFIAVDEAHCISQWGHDFRPSYRDIPVFINQLDLRPTVGAYTATATSFVVEEIKKLLELHNPLELLTGFNRENLIYQVVKPKDKYKYTKEYLAGKSQSSGIIYCSTRKTVESLTSKLKGAGYLVEGYHGGMDPDIRSDVQENFMYGDIKIIVATNAFGMGIDKPDVRFVLHYNMPKNMESYYQEAGRAGRDGDESDCILLYSPADIVKQKLLISQNNQDEERLRIQFENLQYLVNYCHADSCLRQEISSYFGEDIGMDNCGSCGNCLGESSYIDMTKEAQIIMSLIYRTGQRFGLSIIIQTLRGSKNQKIQSWNLNQQSTYGMLKDYSEGALREIMMNLIARGYLHMTTDRFPVLKLTAASKAILKGEENIKVKQERVKVTDHKNRSKRKTSHSHLDYDEKLYEQLAAKRYQIAKENRKAAYLIFSNATLEELAFHKPLTRDGMLDIKGIGDHKYELYGQLFMDVIKDYLDQE